jgi:hypothetical protein
MIRVKRGQDETGEADFLATTVKLTNSHPMVSIMVAL